MPKVGRPKRKPKARRYNNHIGRYMANLVGNWYVTVKRISPDRKWFCTVEDGDFWYPVRDFEPYNPDDEE